MSVSAKCPRICYSFSSHLSPRYSSKQTPEGVSTLVAKIKPLKGELSEEFKNSDVFQKEINIYKKVMPSMIEILKKAGGDLELAPE